MQASQIESQEPPTVCLCCGTQFDDEEHKRRGPYPTSPYIYVCQSCWEKSYLYFPDKVGWGGSGQYPETIIGYPDQEDPRHAMPKQRLETVIVSADRSVLTPGVIKVHLSKLKLDRSNPRLRYHRAVGDSEIEEALWNEPETREWYIEIKADGGVTEPLAIDSKYTVREGNERLVALRRLSRQAHDGEFPQFPKNQFDIIPCYKIRSSLSEREIVLWLARIHVKGKSAWKPVNKAAVVYDLSKKYRMSYDDIRKKVGSSKKTVQTTILSYEETLRYRDERTEDDKWYEKYSYYYEVFKSKELANWARQNNNLKLFGDWISSGKIPKAEYVRRLKKLITDNELYEEFKKANLQRSKEILLSLETGGSKSLDALARATEALRGYPVGEMRALISDNTKWKIVEDLHDELGKFVKTAQALART